MSQHQVPLIVVTARQDNVEAVNRVLREAGHPVRCHWVDELDRLPQNMADHQPQLLLLFLDSGSAMVREAAKIRQQANPMTPLVVITQAADEATIAQAMQDGAQDLLSLAYPSRLVAVAERELRTFRLERALNETLNSATQYKNQLKAVMASTGEAIAYAKEGILVETNQAWNQLFGESSAATSGPLMDLFDAASQAALKGALVACARGQWDADPLRVSALTPEGRSLSLKLLLEAAQFESEAAVRLSVPREPSAAADPEALVENAVHRDAATGFYHRRRFVELLTDRLDEHARNGVRVLAYIRPDKFSEIKNEVGSLASEDILSQLAELLRGLAAPDDLCGRFGGTIFTILLERGTLRDVEAWAENAVSRIADHIFDVAHNTLSITCTIGLAEVTPGADRVESLVRDAEKANQRGRQRGGSQVVLEETADESTRIQRFDAIWVRQIKAALLENRFHLAHLPIASLLGENKAFFDTVVRMTDEQGDEIHATEFMPAAGRNKLLKTIDRWVIGASLDFCLNHKPDRAFVKLSRDSITDPALIDWLVKQGQARKVPPAQLCFQVTEEDATQYLKQTKELAEKLRELGFYFAVEHFGVGRDPMRVLTQVPMHYLKIDGSLMQSLSTNPLLQEQVRNFVSAAEKRKIKTIAERVQDANTMAVLFQIGATYMQGHYVHEPEVVLQEN
jgi:diguanylate cyclase (GGDEF)-like protein